MHSLVCDNTAQRPWVAICLWWQGFSTRMVLGGCLLLLVSGCSSLRSFPQAGTQPVSPGSLFPPFSSESLQKFDLTLKAMGTNFSGMLLIKRTSDTLYRTVFTAYTGLTLFDMSYFPSGCTVNSCMDLINRKSVIKLLSHTFGALFLTPVSPEVNTRKFILNEEPPLEGYRFRKDGTRYEYVVDPKAETLTAITLRTLLSRLRFQLRDYREHNVGSISVRYRGLIGVQMSLKRLE